MPNSPRSKTRTWLFTALLAPFALICLALGVGAVKKLHEAYLLKNDGALTEALVTQLEEKGGRGSSYQVYYAFLVGEERFEGSSQIDKSEFERLKNHSPVSVRYVKNDPGINIADSRSPWITPFNLALASAFGSLCVGMLLKHLHS